MNKTQNTIIQLYAALYLMGYWCMHSIIILLTGTPSANASIIYRAVLLILSFYVIIICRKDFFIEKGKPFFLFYLLIILLFSLRMFYDMYAGPFSLVLPRKMFINDILYTVFGVFSGVLALVTCRRYLDPDKIVNYVFVLCCITLICLVITLSQRGMLNVFEEERMSLGGGIGTLAIVKIGAISILASIHLLINKRINKLLCLGIMVLGVWSAFASGSRGGIVGFIVAIGISLVLLFYKRKKIILLIISISLIICLIIYLVPVLTFLSKYFPVAGERLLLSVVEGDQSNRDILRQEAYQLIKEYPIFGYSYRLNTDLTGYGPHNGILTVMLALGIPMGLLFVYNMYLKAGFMLLKTINTSGFFPTSIAIFVMVTSISGGAIDDNCFGFAMCLLGSIYYYNKQ